MIDILNVNVDTSLPVQKRISTFINDVKNPYSFCVGDTPVKLTFCKNAPKIQDCLQKLAKDLL